MTEDGLTEEEYQEIMADPDLWKSMSITQLFDDIFKTKPSAKLAASAIKMANTELARQMRHDERFKNDGTE